MNRIIWIFLTVLILAGCAKGPVVYYHPDANLAYIKKVAVLPFVNVSNNKNAHELVRDVFVTELLSSGLFEVVNYGETLRALKEREISDVKGLSTEEAKRVGKRLDVQGIIIGTVNEYGMTGRNLPYPEVSISISMIEVPSGVFVWKASHTAKGLTILYRVFGVGGKSNIEVAKKAVRSVVDSLK